MKQAKIFAFSFLIFIVGKMNAQNVITVQHFDKVIVSPHISVTFEEGNNENVSVENISVDKSKLHMEVNNGTLQIYLEGAKTIDGKETVYNNGNKEKHDIYEGTVVTALITYKTLNELSIRGEEKQVCKSALTGDEFTLKIYGESSVVLNEVNLNELHTTMYGESNLEINSGTVTNQRYIAYGEGKVNSLAISGSKSNITAYGEADFNINVRDEIKITAFGEAKLHYKGNPAINKGLHIGELHIEKLDNDL